MRICEQNHACLNAQRRTTSGRTSQGVNSTTPPRKPMCQAPNTRTTDTHIGNNVEAGPSRVCIQALLVCCHRFCFKIAVPCMLAVLLGVVIATPSLTILSLTRSQDWICKGCVGVRWHTDKARSPCEEGYESEGLTESIPFQRYTLIIAAALCLEWHTVSGEACIVRFTVGLGDQGIQGAGGYWPLFMAVVGGADFN